MDTTQTNDNQANDNSQNQSPEKNTKKTHGGSRPGAGRKPKSPGGRRIARNFTANDPEWEKILENAKRAGFENVSEYIRARTL